MMVHRGYEKQKKRSPHWAALNPHQRRRVEETPVSTRCSRRTFGHFCNLSRIFTTLLGMDALSGAPSPYASEFCAMHNEISYPPISFNYKNQKYNHLIIKDFADKSGRRPANILDS